jgi:hypothetical protein
MKIEIIKGTENPVAEFFSSPLETDNERTLKLALEVFTQLAKTLKQERDEARKALASREVVIAQHSVITDLILERDKWSKLCGQYKQERDEAMLKLKNNG